MNCLNGDGDVSVVPGFWLSASVFVLVCLVLVLMLVLVNWWRLFPVVVLNSYLLFLFTALFRPLAGNLRRTYGSKIVSVRDTE